MQSGQLTTPHLYITFDIGYKQKSKGTLLPETNFEFTEDNFSSSPHSIYTLHVKITQL